ncbi:TetR family transcriptional regulator [Nonomuraea sp. 3-1Str]|uniref:TetR family transcriptional regulator n=1 Tax=Nonomuraea sp. 3-1Str TaxID=2929801 RepID=UPI00286531A4|nr:TetR family transcriptional regulator [Nonomuraea sp. 3-1Str]MDR8408240.1 TetR family transcriptional regulator [Nonomuraea sp. 3-1Str]
MAWNTERTRQLLLDAAVQEFAEHGPAGARLDRVASTAGVNKERIYQYFGNKEQLFAAVLTSALERLAEAVPMDDRLAADLPEYAGRVYDYHREHPQLIRLLHWEGLHCGDGPVAAGEQRGAHYAAKLAALAAAQKRGALSAEFAPRELLYAVIALAGWWYATPQLARLIMAESPGSARETLVRVVAKLVG